MQALRGPVAPTLRSGSPRSLPAPSACRCSSLPGAAHRTPTLRVFATGVTEPGHPGAPRRAPGWVLPSRHGTLPVHSRSRARQPRRRWAPARRTLAAAANPAGGGAARRAEGGFGAALRRFVADQFLLLALVVGMTVGWVWPASGLAAANAGLQNFTTTGIFIISGLGLRRGEAMSALSAWGATLYGCVAILALTPLAAYAALALPLAPRELAVGLAVFCCMPTTLSSGVSLTQAVGGNTALALLLTVGTNLAGIFTMPFVLAGVLGGGGAGVAIAPAPLLRALVQTILVPLLVGASARAFIPGVSAAADARKRELAAVSACLLAMVPWMQVSRAVASRVAVGASALAGVVAAGVAIHLAYLALNTAAVSTLRLGGEGPEAVGVRRAVVLVGSQKTLPIAVAVLAQLGAAADGLAVVPCVAAHLSQILIDSLLVSAWLRANRAPPAAAAP